MVITSVTCDNYCNMNGGTSDTRRCSRCGPPDVGWSSLDAESLPVIPASAPPVASYAMRVEEVNEDDGGGCARGHRAATEAVVAG